MTARRVTAKRTRKVTEKITVTVQDAPGPPPPVNYAPGWAGPPLPAAALARQRAGQVLCCLDLLAIWGESAPPGPPPASLIAAAVTALRAGPHATRSELLLGRTA